MALTLTATTGTYINSRTLGQYPNATIEYSGERNFPNVSRFTMRFTLKTEGGSELEKLFWTFEGATPSGNTIQNHGELTWSGATGTTDFITYLQGGGDLDDPTLAVITYPRLSYEDLDNYFVLGGKKDMIGLPAGANPKKLIKWLLLNTVNINREKIGAQFSW
tara:strand:+ start:202 stop:690 length:489 start_codon:yes stop_codon:yes gene_type:complete